MALQPPFGVSKGTTYDWTVNVAVSAVFTLLGCIAILLRSLSWALRGRPMGGDDVAMYLAFLANIGYTIASYISIRWGVGLRRDEVPPSWRVESIKAVYVIEIFYYFAIFLIKVSLLLLYLRIATGLGNKFYKGTIITMAVIIIHFISTLIVEAVQCIPMETYWNSNVPGHCISITAFFYSTNIFTIITDCIILALPVSTLWKINRPRAERVGLLAAFLVGAISTIASCIRLYSVRIYTESNEPMRDAAPINTWSFIEINLGVLCASAPAIKPLFMRGRARHSSLLPGQLTDCISESKHADHATEPDMPKTDHEVEPCKLRRKRTSRALQRQQTDGLGGGAATLSLPLVPTGPLYTSSCIGTAHDPTSDEVDTEAGQIMVKSTVSLHAIHKHNGGESSEPDQNLK